MHVFQTSAPRGECNTLQEGKQTSKTRSLEHASTHLPALPRDKREARAGDVGLRLEQSKSLNAALKAVLKRWSWVAAIATALAGIGVIAAMLQVVIAANTRFDSFREESSALQKRFDEQTKEMDALRKKIDGISSNSKERVDIGKNVAPAK